MLGKIIITNKSEKITEIDIEGIIGIPEDWQFEKDDQQIATYQKFKNTINSISEIETQKIIVNIRSTGGNVGDALLIYETLAALNTEITTRCYGYVASAATIIAQAASKGKREISKNALYLIHNSSSTIEGNAEELNQTADLLTKTDNRIANIYAQRSGKDVSAFTMLMNENNGNGIWLSPEEVIEAGLADKVIEISKIKQQWNSFMKFISGDSGHETFFSEEREPDKNTNRPASKINYAETLDQVIKSYENPKITDAETEKTIKNLQNKIVELEAQNAKLKAKATQTFPKEDPSMRDVKRQGNADAYEEDLRSFKTII